MSHLVTKPTKWHVRPAKTQISLGIRPVWPEDSLSAWRKLGSLAIHQAHSEDSDQTGRMPKLIWVFAWRTVILLVLSLGGSNAPEHLSPKDCRFQDKRFQTPKSEKALLEVIIHSYFLSNKRNFWSLCEYLHFVLVRRNMFKRRSWPRRLVPGLHQRGELSNTIICAFSREQKRV